LHAVPQKIHGFKAEAYDVHAASLVGVTPVLCLSLVLALDFVEVVSPDFPPTFALALLSPIQS